MNKTCTSIEQSKKLLSLGLDPSTADMLYQLNEKEYADTIRVPLTKKHWDSFIPDIYPSWSLTALLELMPLINHDTANLFKEEDGTYTVLYKYTKNSPLIVGKESAIDAAFEMVCWLLKTESYDIK